MVERPIARKGDEAMNKLQPFSDTVTLLSGGRVMREEVFNELDEVPARRRNMGRILQLVLGLGTSVLLLISMGAG
jgi:hypothetical protein